MLKVVVSHKNGDKILDRTEALFDVKNCLFCPEPIVKPKPEIIEPEKSAIEVAMENMVEVDYVEVVDDEEDNPA